MTVIQAKLRDRPVDDGDIATAYNRELKPVVDALRSAANKRFGSVVTVSGDYTVEPGDQYILADASSGPVEISLSGEADTDMRITVKKVDPSANSVTVVTESADSEIDGLASHVIAAQWFSICVITDGTDWFVI